MAHICIGRSCRWTQGRKEEFLGNYQLDHWVGQLQIINEDIKFLIRIAVVDAFV